MPYVLLYSCFYIMVFAPRR